MTIKSCQPLAIIVLEAGLDTLRERLLKLVRDRGHVTFAELTQRWFPEEGSGSACLMGPKHGLVLWPNLSPELAYEIREGFKAGELFLWKSEVWHYMQDGAIPKGLEIADKIREYKKPRWLPACLHYEPCPDFEAQIS